MEPKKYILANQVVFLALTRHQVIKFLKKYGLNQKQYLIENATDNDYIDFNLIELNQNEFVLKNNIPFRKKSRINLRCPYLAYMPTDMGDRRKKEYNLTRNYFCCNHWVKLKAAQLDSEYALLERCCGEFNELFYKELNKNV